MFLAVVRDFACFRVFSFFLRIFAEFSRKFARKVHEEPHRLGLRFFFYTIAKVFRRFQVARDSFSLLKPRKLRSRLSKFRIFALIVFVSFSKIQSNHALPRGGGICGNAQRRLPGKNKILCAWRAEIPEILQIFPILSQDVGINFALSRRRAPA